MAQKEGGWTVVKDPTGSMGPYAYKGDQWVGYDDPAIIKLKVRMTNYFKQWYLFDLQSHFD